jgi:hypothetical protein
MMKHLRFHQTYFILTLLLLLIEIGIALFVHDRFIRPYMGDVLVVILIYCFIRSFLITPALPVAVTVLLFAYVVEYLQWLQLVKRLGLQNNTMARIIIGSSFEWLDIAAYTTGIMIVLVTEQLLKKKT